MYFEYKKPQVFKNVLTGIHMKNVLFLMSIHIWHLWRLCNTVVSVSLLIVCIILCLHFSQKWVFMYSIIDNVNYVFDYFVGTLDDVVSMNEN